MSRPIFSDITVVQRVYTRCYLFTSALSQEDNFEEIDASAILAPGARRSTRGVRVDYSSAEALAKAGLKPEAADEDEAEESFVAPDDEMKD